MSFEEQREKRQKIYAFSRSLLDYIMGLMVVAAGVIFIKKDHFGIKQIQKADSDGILIPLFGAVCLLYGFWRIYRGYRKNY
ncbi:MAG: hypothetical protein JNM68_05710 [Dinghuibacter sp.]|nr:hypothetical protein [Dinghuibacter sp.]